MSRDWPLCKSNEVHPGPSLDLLQGVREEKGEKDPRRDLLAVLVSLMRRWNLKEVSLHRTEKTTSEALGTRQRIKDSQASDLKVGTVYVHPSN